MRSLSAPNRSESSSLRPSPSVTDRKFRYATPALVLIGIGGGIYVNLGGRIAVGELIAIALAGTLLLPQLMKTKWAQSLTLVVAILLVGLLTGSLAFGDSWSVLGIVGVNYLALTLSSITIAVLLVSGTARSPLAFLGSLAIGQILGVIVNPTATALIDPWKFGVGAGVALLVLVVVDAAKGHAGIRLTSIAGALAVALYSFYAGSRSLGMFVVLALVFGSLWFAQVRIRRRGAGILVLVVAIVGAWIGLLVYDYAALNGWLGASASTKYFSQLGDFGLLPGARKEIIVLSGAWMASPVFGWGASGSVPAEVRLGALEWFTRYGYSIDFSTYMNLFGTNDTPLHSVTLGALIQAGVFALPFIVVALMYLYRGLNAVALVRARMAGAFVIIAAIAHFLMSPLGDITRMPIAAGIAFAIYASVSAQTVNFSALSLASTDSAEKSPGSRPKVSARAR